MFENTWNCHSTGRIFFYLGINLKEMSIFLNTPLKRLRDFLIAHDVQVLRHPPYSPDLTPADFFLFRHVKEELAGVTLDHSTLKKEWEGITRSISAEEFATTFWRWFERCQKCIEIGGGYVKKS